MMFALLVWLALGPVPFDNTCAMLTALSLTPPRCIRLQRPIVDVKTLLV